MEITVEEYSNRKNHILQRLEQVEQQDFKTKTQFVKELIEITVPVIEEGLIEGIDGYQTAKYLWQELVKHNVEYDYSTFIKHFPEEHKRKYLKSGHTPHLKHNFLEVDKLSDGTIVSRCECGKKAFDGMPVSLDLKVEETKEKQPQIQPKKAKLPDSVIRESIKTLMGFLLQYSILVKEFDKKCQDPKILEDLENTMEYRDLAEMFKSLENLYSVTALSHEDGPATIMDQMKSETNFRAPATPLQLGMCYLLQSLTTFRQWAHKLSVSPRQHQRIRERLAEWPAKLASKIIENVIGSHTCPNCEFNLVSKKGNPRLKIVGQKVRPQKIIFGEKWYQIPKEYEGKGMNPIDVAYEVFKGKFKLKK